MIVRIGLENGYCERSIAWVLEFPGCFANGAEGSEAILKVPQELVAYQDWIASHTQASWLADLGNFDVSLSEALESKPGGSSSTNWFRHDATPLSPIDAERGALVLTWLRADLLDFVSTLASKYLDQTFADERWSIRGILGHIADAEWWYLDRLGLSGCAKSALPADEFERLRLVRERLLAVLPELAGRADVVNLDEETWSARKLLRRAAWHEKDHIQHILRLMTLL